MWEASGKWTTQQTHILLNTHTGEYSECTQVCCLTCGEVRHLHCWLTTDGSYQPTDNLFKKIKLPSRVPRGAWQLRPHAPHSCYLFRPLSTPRARQGRCRWCWGDSCRVVTPKSKFKASGVVVSPKEVFMNAAAAIPETRSGRIHQ